MPQNLGTPYYEDDVEEEEEASQDPESRLVEVAADVDLGLDDRLLEVGNRDRN